MFSLNMWLTTELIVYREGDTEETRWKWNETIGPVEDRPGHQGTWTYYNTDGLGMCPLTVRYHYLSNKQ